MYRMITIDIDDTLLNDRRQISEGNRRALKAAIDRGVTVSLATGRMHRSARQVAEQIGLQAPVISYQGALIKNWPDDATLYERSVPASAAHRVDEFCRRQGFHLQVYSDDVLYVKEEGEKIRHYIQISNVPFKVEPDFTRLLDRPLTKLLIYEEPAVLDQIAQELRPILGDEVHITKSKPFFLEFMHKQGTKGQALRFLSAHFGYDLSEVMAIGDSWNDHDMLQTAGLGVAVANAVEPLKRIADEITLSNNEDGVKHIVEKYILG